MSYARRVGVSVASIDHVVLTVRDVEATVAFYERVLGMHGIWFAGGGRRALAFGAQKLNLHEAGREHTPNASSAGPGTADLCLLTATPLDEILDHLQAEGVEVEQGPSTADGAQGPLQSIWLRDPDGNLIEVSNPLAV